MPVIGSNPTVIPIFWICWNNNIPTTPLKIYLFLLIFFLFIKEIIYQSNKRNKLIKIKTPQSPKLEAYTAKINEINDPVKSEHGWHLIKVTEIKHFSDKENFSRRYF